MKEYPQILNKIRSTPWLITESGLQSILDIAERRLNGQILDEEVRNLIAERREGRSNGAKARGSIGIIPLHGPIFGKANLMTELSGAVSLEQWRQDFRSLVDNDMVSSILVNIDSPGGVTDLVVETANEIRSARKIKPVYAVADTMAASAAYMIASQATELYVTDSGYVGSVGVYTVHTDDSELKERIGVKETVLKVGRFKAASVTPLTPETREHIGEQLLDVYDYFVEAVALGRNTTVEDVMENYGEGGVVGAKKALEAGMVDGIETFDSLLARLAEGGGILEPVGTRASSGGGANFRASHEKEKEHSEPGTGLGGEPAPRTPPEDEQVDQWNKGERLNRPPNIPELEDQQIMEREQLLAYAGRLGISDADSLSDEDLATKVAEGLDSALERVADLDNAVASAQEHRAFAEQYPEQAAELQRLKESAQKNDAVAFANGFSRLKEADGTETKFGLSIPVRTKIEEAHLKLTQGNFLPSDLAELLNMVASKNATVEFGESGSSRVTESDQAVPSDRREARQMFANKVEELMTEDNLDRKAAIAEASKRHPQLAEAYARS